VITRYSEGVESCCDHRPYNWGLSFALLLTVAYDLEIRRKINYQSGVSLSEKW